MPYRDDRVESGTGEEPMPGIRQPGAFSGSLPAGSKMVLPSLGKAPAQDHAPSTGQLAPCAPSTGQLTNAQITRVLTITMPPIPENASQRVPVVIKASMKRPAPAPPPLPPDEQKRRRLKVTLAGLVMLVLIVALLFLLVTPLGHDISLGNPLDLPGSSILTGQNPGLTNPIAQATATAVFHRRTDGYDPSFYGSQLISDGSHSLAWPMGQCTYWANYEYHLLTGYWVPWNGNANQWVAGARMAGWHVSTSPHVPSIIVLMGVQGANSYYGHVAVVQGVSGNVVHTSNMNWYSNGGGWNRVSNVDFTAGRGVYFIWHS